MSPEDAFLQAVLEAPDDEVPRLVYADWLEEMGDPRAEFIRLQIEVARITGDEFRLMSLLRRVRQLLRDHQRDWVRPLAHRVEGWEFRRGFVEKVQMTPAADWAEVLALAPIRCIHFYRRHHLSLAEVECFSQSPGLARLTTLKLNTDRGLGNDGAGLLAASPYLRGLRCLDLSNNFIKNDGAQLLAASPYLGGLQTLHLQNNPIGPPGKRALRARFGERVEL
jgi:uncharacterized protein (TIGR02996 family)